MRRLKRFFLLTLLFSPAITFAQLGAQQKADAQRVIERDLQRLRYDDTSGKTPRRLDAMISQGTPEQQGRYHDWQRYQSNSRNTTTSQGSGLSSSSGASSLRNSFTDDPPYNPKVSRSIQHGIQDIRAGCATSSDASVLAYCQALGH